MKKNIFVACDFSSQDEVINLIEKIKNHIFGIKVGLQYVTATGISGIQALAKFNLPIIALGMGEKEDDLEIFNANHFANAIMTE